MKHSTKNTTENLIGLVGSYLLPHNLFGKVEAAEVHGKASNTKELDHNGVTWIDIENPTNATLKKLAESYPLSPLHSDLSVMEQLPTVEKEKDYAFATIYVPGFDPEQNKITNSQLGIFWGKDFLITIHDASNHAVRGMFNSCHRHQEVLEEYFKKSSGHLLNTITSNLTQDLSSLTKALVQELDDIEDSVFDVDTSDAYPISRLRQKIIRLKRITGSFKGVMEDLAPIASGFGGEGLGRSFSNHARTASKLLETIEEAKETIEIYKDADYTASTEKTNEILAVLTLIFTFTIPPTVLGTFFGMNILLPGGIETGPWDFLGKYTTLIIVVSLSVGTVLWMFWYFRKKKWF